MNEEAEYTDLRATVLAYGPSHVKARASRSSARHVCLGTLLAEARQAAGLTQASLSKRLGKQQSFVSNYEKGERRLDVIEFLDVAELIGCEVGPILEAVKTKKTT